MASMLTSTVIAAEPPAGKGSSMVQAKDVQAAAGDRTLLYLAPGEKPVDKAPFPIIQIREFLPTVCDAKILGVDYTVIENAPSFGHPDDMEGAIILDTCNGQLKNDPKLTKLCKELPSDPKFQAFIARHFEVCTSQAAIEAANAWMASEGGKVKVLSVQAVKRKVANKRRNDREVEAILVTYEAPASPPSVAEPNKK